MERQDIAQALVNRILDDASYDFILALASELLIKQYSEYSADELATEIKETYGDDDNFSVDKFVEDYL